MTKFVEVDSIEYDFIPGERQSRRTWQIILRRPVEEGMIRRNMKIKLHIKNSRETIISEDKIFRVDDIHGRILLVTPISDVDLISESNMYLTNIDEHVHPSAGITRNKYLYKHRNIVYGNGLHHNRMGRSMYTPRPFYHNSTRTYISFGY